MPSDYTRKEPQGKNTTGLHLSFKHHSCHSFMDTLLFSSIILLRMTQFTLVSAAVIPDSAITNCPKKCGNVDISLPFGIGEGCFLKGFEIICNQSIPYLSKSNLQLLEILPGEVRVNSTNFIAKTCFSEDEHTGQAEIQLPEERPYRISITKNILVGIGCEMSALASSPNMYRTSCASFCPTDESMINGSCNGIGCCQMPLPPVNNNLLIEVHQYESSINNCSYAFIVENGTYNFTESDLLDFNRANISMTLEWSGEIGLWNCSVARNFACGETSQCKDLEEGHLCTCLQGYKAKPKFPYDPYRFLECQG